MKKATLVILNFYQIFISPFLKLLLGTTAICQFSPSCSEYTKRMIQQHGVLVGTKLGIERLVTCR